MNKIVLSNKPLIEAIFELRWELKEIIPNVKIDPEYKLLIGRVYDRVRDNYPYHESLDSAKMPDEIAAYLVQHRFRRKDKGWPLIQLGPGIITLNDTEGYLWDDFANRVSDVINITFDAYPDAEEKLRVNSLLLRYIDAIEFDYSKNNIFEFLKNQLKIGVSMHNKLFDDTGVNNLPLSYDLRFAFHSSKPKGAVRLRFVRGKRKGVDSIVWETMVESVSENCPKNKNEIIYWVNEAHNVTHDWFFKLIEGELYERFK
jgi:uncharacterized protein (TIGR04255 family)